MRSTEITATHLPDKTQIQLCQTVYAYTSLAMQHKEYHPNKLANLIDSNIPINNLHRKYVVAKDVLLRTNAKLVAKMVQTRLLYSWQRDEEDLLQKGFIGLSTAIDRYVPTSKAKLSTYAYYWIFKEIAPSSSKYYNGAIYFPLRAKYLSNEIIKGEKSDAQLINDYGISAPFYEKIKSLSGAFRNTMFISDSKNCLEELADPNLQDFSHKKEVSDSILHLIATCLDKNETMVINSLFFLPKSLAHKEIAEKLGLPVSAVAAIKLSAFKKIRDEILQRSRLDLIDSTAYD